MSCDSQLVLIYPHFLLSPFKVNPIAVNSKYCNVFTENKRVVSIISTKEFGKVCHCKQFLSLISLEDNILCLLEDSLFTYAVLIMSLLVLQQFFFGYVY